MQDHSGLEERPQAALPGDSRPQAALPGDLRPQADLGGVFTGRGSHLWDPCWPFHLIAAGQPFTQEQVIHPLQKTGICIGVML